MVCFRQIFAEKLVVVWEPLVLWLVALAAKAALDILGKVEAAFTAFSRREKWNLVLFVHVLKALHTRVAKFQHGGSWSEGCNHRPYRSIEIF